MSEIIHKPVLLKEVIECLNLAPGKNIIDATMDGGGYAVAILEKIAPEGLPAGEAGKLLGIEIDNTLIRGTELRIKEAGFSKNAILMNDSYVNLKKICEEKKFEPDGIVFDLGLSSWHLEQSKRGFSFKKDEILDMRFNPETQPKTAAEIINQYGVEDLEKIFKEYGEEQFAESIAKAIVRARKSKPIIRTQELVGVIEPAVPEWYKHRKIHCATKTFQALRIEVNDELENVRRGVSAAIDVLKSKGRLAVVSFQGLEDKMVKEIFKEKTKEGIIKFVVKGTIKPTWNEQKENPRSRSAKMKIVEKL